MQSAQGGEGPGHFMRGHLSEQLPLARRLSEVALDKGEKEREREKGERERREREREGRERERREREREREGREREKGEREGRGRREREKTIASVKIYHFLYKLNQPVKVGLWILNFHPRH